MNDGTMELAETFGEVARLLLAERQVEETLQKITDLAVTVVDPCEHAGIDIVEKRQVRAAAPSSDVAVRIDAIQVETGEGPCLDAIREQAVFHTDDLSDESRWPNFASRAYEETGIRSIIGFRLFADEETMGALDLYSTQPGAFDETAAAVGSVLASHAAVAWWSARERENLERALETRDVIGQAKGILMAQRDVSDDDAFELLRVASQRLNVKLREIAERVVAGEPPDQRAS